MAAALAVASSGEIYDVTTVQWAQKIAAPAPWRLDKEVFVLDKDMEALLYEQADEDIKIPIEIFLHLPYLCFYIELHNLTLEDIQQKGMFVHLECDANTGEKERRLFVVVSACLPARILGVGIGATIGRASRMIFPSESLFCNGHLLHLSDFPAIHPGKNYL